VLFDLIFFNDPEEERNMTNLLAKHTPLIIECWQDPGYSNPDLLKFNESLEECGGDDLDETLLSVQHRESTVIKAVKKF
jgi:hypothetical protein